MPTALKTMEGLGLSVEIIGAHFEVLDSWKASSLLVVVVVVVGEVGDDDDDDDWGLGKLREIVLMEVKDSSSRRVLRMWRPTAPVQPNTAAVVMLGKGKVGKELDRGIKGREGVC